MLPRSLFSRPVGLAAFVGVLTALASLPARAQFDLGAASTFAVLAASTVTNTGPTTVYGDLGVSPGLAVTGFGPGLVIDGTLHAGDSLAAQARADATAAYGQLAGLAFTQDLTGQDLGGRTLTPGVYFFASSVALTGTLTLDALGLPDARFVFQIGSTLDAAPLSAIAFINGADALDAFFQVGSSATFGAGARFAGTVLALASDTFVTGASLEGRVFALNGAVTLDTNVIRNPARADGGVTPPFAAVPEPAATALAGAGLVLVVGVIRRWRAARPVGGGLAG